MRSGKINEWINKGRSAGQILRFWERLWRSIACCNIILRMKRKLILISTHDNTSHLQFVFVPRITNLHLHVARNLAAMDVWYKT